MRRYDPYSSHWADDSDASHPIALLSLMKLVISSGERLLEIQLLLMEVCLVIRRAFCILMFGTLSAQFVGGQVVQPDATIKSKQVLTTKHVSSQSASLTEVKPNQVEWEKDFEEGRRNMDRLQRPMMIFVTVPGCVYCEKMKTSTFSQKWIAEQIHKRFVPVEMNGIEKEKLAKRLKVRVYPTTAVVSPQGRVIEVIHGYQPAVEFLKHMAVIDAKIKTLVATQPSASPTTVQLK